MNRPQPFDVDGAMAQISLEEAAARCGLQLQVQGGGAEVRIECPFGCGGDHAGRYEISVNTGHPAKLWKCHSYGCQMRGNLLNLMHGWVNGSPWTGSRLHGREFLRVKQALMTETAADASPTPPSTPAPPPEPEVKPSKPKRNIPLLESADPRTRSLMEPPLYEKLVTDIANMSPKVSAGRNHHAAGSYAAFW